MAGSGARGIIDAGKAPRPRPTRSDLRRVPADSICDFKKRRTNLFFTQIFNPGTDWVLNPKDIWHPSSRFSKEKKNWHRLALPLGLSPPHWPKRLVLPCKGLCWGLPKSLNVEKKNNKEGVRSVALHRVAKASPLRVRRSFRDNVLILLAWSFWHGGEGCEVAVKA